MAPTELNWHYTRGPLVLSFAENPQSPWSRGWIALQDVVDLGLEEAENPPSPFRLVSLKANKATDRGGHDQVRSNDTIGQTRNAVIFGGHLNPLMLPQRRTTRPPRCTPEPMPAPERRGSRSPGERPCLSNWSHRA